MLLLVFKANPIRTPVWEWMLEELAIYFLLPAEWSANLCICSLCNVNSACCARVWEWMLEELAIYFLLHAKGANLRHVPEGLWFLFWTMRNSPRRPGLVRICDCTTCTWQIYMPVWVIYGAPNAYQTTTEPPSLSQGMHRHILNSAITSCTRWAKNNNT